MSWRVSDRSPAGGERSGPALRAFEGCGVELEYMVVARDSLDVRPLADTVLQRASASSAPVNDIERGDLGWSNELVMHVLELKNMKPTVPLSVLGSLIHDEIRAFESVLQPLGVQLMPGGMHPWMDPRTETRLWPHDNAPIYAAYDRIFGCANHGWANLQALHVNLPFGNDAEFARLHAAVRMVLPLLPALAASSPYMEGRATGVLDNRMEAYRGNADQVPALNGQLVPDAVASRADYERDVLRPMYRAIAPHDREGVLQHEWLNARGAIPRFDRHALEIRVVDMQECPYMDIGLTAFLVDVSHDLYERCFGRPSIENQLPTATLARVLNACINDADRARIDCEEYLAVMGVRRRECTAHALLSSLAEDLERRNSANAALWRAPLEYVLDRGPLARRLLRALGPRPSRAALHELYSALCGALQANRPFDP